MKSETESKLIASHDQVLQTKSHETRIFANRKTQQMQTMSTI